jgi:hypothetical protein
MMKETGRTRSFNGFRVGNFARMYDVRRIQNKHSLARSQKELTFFGKLAKCPFSPSKSHSETIRSE